MNPSDLQNCIQLLLDDELPAEELAALEAELLENPAALETYRSYIDLHCGLQGRGTIRAAADQLPVVPVDRVLALQRRRLVKNSFLAAAAIVLISATALWLIMAPGRPASIAGFQTAPNSVFTLTHAGEGEAPMGRALAEGSRVVLEHGVAELQLPNEVRAIVEAPAAMVLVDDMTLQLDHGRAFFHVPTEEGRGFTVFTPHQRIVDLGTAFGIDARSDRDEVELHVFKGKVRVDDNGGGKGEVITANRSVLLAGTRVERDLAGPPTAFRQELPDQVETVFLDDFESGLVGGRDYAVQIDPTAIRDLAGNRFPGIADDKTWNFATLSNPAAIAIPNPGFEEQSRAPEGHPVPLAWETNSNEFRPRSGIGVLTPTDGSWQAWMNKGTSGYQDTGEVIVAGTTYTLKVDLGADQDHFPEIETVVIRLFGSDAGFGTALAEITPNGPATTTWLTDQTVSFTAAPSQATGQTLGIYLGVTGGTQVEWDNVRLEAALPTDGDGLPDSYELAHTDPPSATALRPGDDLEDGGSGDGLTNLQEFQHGTDPRNPDTDGDGVEDGAELAAGTDPTSPPVPDALDSLPATEPDTTPPVIALLHPADDATDVMPTGRLTMTFDEPIKFGTGRIVLRNITDWVETEIAVGGPRTSIEGRVLTIIPPADLKDGDIQMGRIGGWECDAWAGIFNPGGKGSWYVADGLEDKGQNRGTIGSMRGPVMATFGESRPGTGIRRVFGAIAPGSRYTVSVAIGVRTESAGQAAAFDGYTIRLSSGDIVLAELSDDTLPGPPNSVTNAGFSWDSSTLPEGVKPGDPLAIEIAPNQASGEAPGYLDVDNVRVSVVGE